MNVYVIEWFDNLGDTHQSLLVSKTKEKALAFFEKKHHHHALDLDRIFVQKIDLDITKIVELQ